MEKEIRETSSLTDVDFDVILKVVKTSDASSEIISALQDLKQDFNIENFNDLKYTSNLGSMFLESIHSVSPGSISQYYVICNGWILKDTDIQSATDFVLVEKVVVPLSTAVTAVLSSKFDQVYTLDKSTIITSLLFSQSHSIRVRMPNFLNRDSISFLKR